MVAAGLSLEAALAGRPWRAVRRDPVAESGKLPDEAFLILRLHRLPIRRPFAVHKHFRLLAVRCRPLLIGRHLSIMARWGWFSRARRRFGHRSSDDRLRRRSPAGG